MAGIKRYNGTAWVACTFKRYTGTVWALPVIKRWTGTVWQVLSSVGNLIWTTTAQSASSEGNGSNVEEAWFQIETNGSITCFRTGDIANWGSSIVDNTQFEWRWTSKSNIDYWDGLQNTWYTCNNTGRFGQNAGTSTKSGNVVIEFRKQGGTAVAKTCTVVRNIGG